MLKDERRTSNVQRPTSNVQRPTSNNFKADAHFVHEFFWWFWPNTQAAVFPYHISVSLFSSIRCSMLDVRCSMFIFFRSIFLPLTFRV